MEEDGKDKEIREIVSSCTFVELRSAREEGVLIILYTRNSQEEQVQGNSVNVGK